jgi:hypothetical protein
VLYIWLNRQNAGTEYETEDANCEDTEADKGDRNGKESETGEDE